MALVWYMVITFYCAPLFAQSAFGSVTATMPHAGCWGIRRGANPQRFHLIAPYTSDAAKWERMPWTDISSRETFRITTDEWMWGDDTALVQSYGDVIARYSTHPETKSLGTGGDICGQRTVGLLQRWPVVLGDWVHIGKETNRLEEVERDRCTTSQ